MASSTRSEGAPRLALTLALVLGLAAPAAPAAPATPATRATPAAKAPPGVKARARAEALEGKKAYDTGDYAAAIKHYEEAYRLRPAPGLLFNLGQSHRKAGDLEGAVSYFRRYLETNPPAGQARATEDLITQLEAERVERAAQLAAEEARQREAEASANRQRLEELRLAMERSQSEALSRKLELELAAEARQQQATPVVQTWWFWTAVGAVVAGGAVAAVVLSQPHATPTTFADINAR